MSRHDEWRRWRGFALGALHWTEQDFWSCSWRGFADAWAGYSHHVLGLDPEQNGLTPAEARVLEAELRAWQRDEPRGP